VRSVDVTGARSRVVACLTDAAIPAK
jgi:hypothetical protein